jgi:hypothetical protein
MKSFRVMIAAHAERAVGGRVKKVAELVHVADVG